MKSYQLRDDEIEGRVNRTMRTTTAVAVAVLVLCLMAGRCKCEHYKAVIYSIERESGVVEQMSDTTEVVRLIGKPNLHYWLLPDVPKYKLFWDKY